MGVRRLAFEGWSLEKGGKARYYHSVAPGGRGVCGDFS